MRSIYVDGTLWLFLRDTSCGCTGATASVVHINTVLYIALEPVAAYRVYP